MGLSVLCLGLQGEKERGLLTNGSLGAQCLVQGKRETLNTREMLMYPYNFSVALNVYGEVITFSISRMTF